MKKIYSLILICTVSFSIKAQYTVTAAMAPVVGDIQRSWQADTTGIVPGSAGTNQIWNYFGVTVSPTVAVTSTSYVAVNTAPNYLSFVGATIANTSDGINYQYESYGSNVTLYGQGNNTLSIVYGNPLTICSLPFSYGMASSDTYSTSYVTGGNTITALGSFTTTADGWGTLNMPGGKSYPNTLRLKVQSVTTGTNGAFTYTQTALGYSHLCSASKSSILSINISTTTAKSGTFTSVSKNKNVSVNDAIFAGIKENYLNTNFSIYPNPTSGKEVSLSFNLAIAENYDVTIINVMGQCVKTVSYGELSQGWHNKTLDLSGLSSGIYYVKLTGQNKEGMKKLIIE